MKRLHKIALGVVAMVAVGTGFSGCGDDGKSPLMEVTFEPYVGMVAALQSRNDDTIIKKMTISGRNGKCDIKNLGAGGDWTFALQNVKYGEKLPYGTIRAVIFDGSDNKCPPKNGKYKIELNTNFGTYYYEL